jgi:hypothetical protein
MAVHSVSPGSTTVQQVQPPRQTQQPQAVDKPAEPVKPPPPPPVSATPTVNTNGQRIGTTISTSA